MKFFSLKLIIILNVPSLLFIIASGLKTLFVVIFLKEKSLGLAFSNVTKTDSFVFVLLKDKFNSTLLEVVVIFELIESNVIPLILLTILIQIL